MPDGAAAPLLDAEEGEQAEEQEGCCTFFLKVATPPASALHFPAVRRYAKDPKDHWWPTAKAWDKMMPHKIKVRWTNSQITVGNEAVRSVARRLREIVLAGNVIRLDVQSGRAFTLQGMQEYLCYQEPHVTAKEWNSLPMADVDQRIRWYETQATAEIRWDPVCHAAVTFAEMRDRDREGIHLSIPEQLLDHWESLDQVNREPLPLQCVAGPAVPIAFWALKMTWLFFLIVPLPVYWQSYESSGIYKQSSLESLLGIHTQPAKGQAVYPTVLVWTVVGPYILYLMSLEWKALQYVIIPIVQVTGGFSVFTKQCGFYIWLAFSFGMSLISHLDLVTNGIFLATSWKTYQYDLGPKIDCIWTATMQKSMFSIVPVGVKDNYEIVRLTDVCHFTFRYLVFWLWMFMLTQAIYGYVCATPLYHIYHRYVRGIAWLERWYKRLEEKKGWDPRGITEEQRWCPRSRAYKSYQQLECDFRGEFSQQELQDWWGNNMMNTGRGSHIATEAYLSDMVDYKPKDYQYAKAFINQSAGQGTRYQAYFDETRDIFSDHGSAVIALADSCRMYSISAMQAEYSKKKVAYYLDVNNQGPAFGLTKRVFVAIGHKVMLSGILQNGLQINLQVTFFAMITLLLNPDRKEGLAFSHDAIFSINAQTFFSIGISLCMMAKNVYEAFLLFWWAGHVIYRESGLDNQNDYLTILKRKYRFLRFALVIYSFVILYAFAKLMAIFYCPHSMYNLWGCANISTNDTEGMCPGSRLLNNATVP